MVRQLHKLFVSNLPLTVGSLQLKKYIVENFGKAFNATVIFNKETGLSQQYGFINVTPETLVNIEKQERHLVEGSWVIFKQSSR